MASDWNKFYTKAGLLLFYYNTRTAEHRWPDWANNDVCQSEAIKSIEINSDWMGFLCKSDELLFYYNKKTNEHRWPDLSVNNTFENAIPADGKPPYEDVSTQTALEELHEQGQNDQLHSDNDTWALSDAKSDPVSRPDLQQGFEDASLQRSRAKKDHVLNVGSSKAGESQINHNSDDHASLPTNVDIELLDALTENSIISKELDEPALNTTNERIHNGYTDVNHNSDNCCSTTSNAAVIGLLHEPMENSVFNKDPSATKMNNENAVNEKISDGEKVNLNVNNQSSTTPNHDTGLLDAPMESFVSSKDLGATAMNASNANDNNEEILDDDIGNLISYDSCSSLPNNIDTELVDASLETFAANKHLGGTYADIELLDEPMVDSLVHRDLNATAVTNSNVATKEVHGGNKLNSDKHRATEATNTDIELLDELMEEPLVNKDLDAAAVNTSNNDAGNEEMNDGNKPIKEENCDEYSDNKSITGTINTSNNVEEQRNSERTIQNPQLSNEISANNGLPTEEERKENSQSCNNQSSTDANTKSIFEQEKQNKQHSPNSTNTSKSNAAKPPRKRPYKCKVCGKTFDRGHRFDRHARTHTKGAITCHVCGEIFAGKASLSNHMNIHSGTKSHQCKTCGKCFTQAGNLQVHERVHTGVKPYKCDICGKKFSQIGNLRAHIRIHTGDTPYHCKLCDGKFRQLSHLISHEKNFHKLKR